MQASILGGMGPLLFIVLLVVPIAELWVILRVADRVGLLSTLGLLVLVSIAGAWLLKQQGLATWQRLQVSLRRGRMPSSEISDGALILFGGALLLTPGFITDVVGILLLLPPTRALVKRALWRSMGAWVGRRWGVRPPSARVYEAEVVTPGRGEEQRRHPAPPRPEVAPGEDDSPDRE